MIIDDLKNADLYKALSPRIAKGLEYLQTTDFTTLAKGKYPIDEDKVIASVSEFETIDDTDEKMEGHRNHIDIQYWVSGEEKVGHDMFNNHELAKEYNETKDVLHVNGKPSFFSVMKAGMFAIYFPQDLHMPGIKNETAGHVKKVVVKVEI